MWESGFLINETPRALSKRMVRTVQVLVLCSIWGHFSRKEGLPSLAGWSAQQMH